MVAISLYRGNLHRLPPDVHRRWLMPQSTISLRSFRILLRRRARSLARYRSPPHGDGARPPTTVASAAGSGGGVGPWKAEESAVGGEKGGALAAVPVEEHNSTGGEGGSVEIEKAAVAAPVEAEATHISDPAKDKRKKELEEKLHTLKERKHQLVQALRQILNVEEEMKKRSSMQVAGSRELEGESHVHQMHMASPSAASPLGRTASSPFQLSMAPLSNRVNHPASGQGPTTSNTPAGVIASPSRFAPPGHHGHPSNLLSVSVSGTQYAASSSSPAASGGTSAFRDGRLTSPSWN